MLKLNLDLTSALNPSSAKTLHPKPARTFAQR
jgi:hypothetical protein